MNDIEDLLRRAFDDPQRRIDAVPQHVEGYRLRARSLHRRRTVAGAVAVAATFAAVVGVGIAVSRPGSKGTGKTPPAGQSVSVPVSVSPGPLSAQTLGDGPDAVDAQLADGSLWVLSGDGTIHKLDPSTGNYESGGYSAAGPQQTGIVADGKSAWTWAAVAGGGDIRLREYDAATQADIRSASLHPYVFSAAILRGDLWLATDAGLYRVAANSSTPELVGNFQQPFAIAADVERNQLLLGVDRFVIRYDPATRKEVARVDVGLGKISLALTGNRQLWAAGYDIPGPVDRKVVHLDPGTLAVLGTTPINAEIGPGATVYPGESVVWVENNGNHINCVDAKTGEVLSTGLDGNFKVGSTTGYAFRVNSGIQRLTLPASCPG